MEVPRSFYELIFGRKEMCSQYLWFWNNSSSYSYLFRWMSSMVGSFQISIFFKASRRCLHRGQNHLLAPVIFSSFKKWRRQSCVENSIIRCGTDERAANWPKEAHLIGLMGSFTEGLHIKVPPSKNYQSRNPLRNFCSAKIRLKFFKKNSLQSFGELIRCNHGLNYTLQI